MNQRIIDRFEKKIVKGKSCWEWIGGPKFRIGKNMILPHAASWEIYKGKREPRNVVDRICENKKCVNPEHLFLVDVADASCYREKRIKMTCPKGHPLDKIKNNGYYGGRRCGECDRKRAQKQRNKIKIEKEGIPI